jgi:hypothetical protein
MDELNASKFKEQCLALLDHLEPRRIGHHEAWETGGAADSDRVGLR